MYIGHLDALCESYMLIYIYHPLKLIKKTKKKHFYLFFETVSFGLCIKRPQSKWKNLRRKKQLYFLRTFILFDRVRVFWKRHFILCVTVKSLYFLFKRNSSFFLNYCYNSFFFLFLYNCKFIIFRNRYDLNVSIYCSELCMLEIKM